MSCYQCGVDMEITDTDPSDGRTYYECPDCGAEDSAPAE